MTGDPFSNGHVDEYPGPVDGLETIEDAEFGVRTDLLYGWQSLLRRPEGLMAELEDAEFVPISEKHPGAEFAAMEKAVDIVLEEFLKPDGAQNFPAGAVAYMRVRNGILILGRGHSTDHENGVPERQGQYHAEWEAGEQASRNLFTIAKLADHFNNNGASEPVEVPEELMERVEVASTLEPCQACQPYLLDKGISHLHYLMPREYIEEDSPVAAQQGLPQLMHHRPEERISAASPVLTYGINQVADEDLLERIKLVMKHVPIDWRTRPQGPGKFRDFMPNPETLPEMTTHSVGTEGFSVTIESTTTGNAEPIPLDEGHTVVIK